VATIATKDGTQISWPTCKGRVIADLLTPAQARRNVPLHARWDMVIRRGC